MSYKHAMENVGHSNNMDLLRTPSSTCRAFCPGHGLSQGVGGGEGGGGEQESGRREDWLCWQALGQAAARPHLVSSASETCWKDDRSLISFSVHSAHNYFQEKSCSR